MRAINSFSYIERNMLVALSDLLKNAIGLSSCIRTAPSPMSVASVSTINYLLKPGSANSGVEDIATLSLSNAFRASESQWNNFFGRRFVNGLVKMS
jgi:hypothetical protein